MCTCRRLKSSILGTSETDGDILIRLQLDNRGCFHKQNKKREADASLSCGTTNHEWLQSFLSFAILIFFYILNDRMMG